MKLPGIFTLIVAATTLPVSAQEVLRYSINWPSGLSLGEATLQSRALSLGKDAPSRLEHQFTLDASIPGFSVIDKYRSLATLDQCSIEFEKRIQHGSRKGMEITTFKPDQGTATRETQGGGKTDFPIAGCAKDGLAFFYWLRSELAQGRLPAGTQRIFVGAPYEIAVQFTGQQEITVSERKVVGERLNAKLKGPASEFSFEMFFTTDPSRKLLMVRLPLTTGHFSMELVD